MNSFSTSKDTLAFLEKYPQLAKDPNLEMLQNKVPKVDASTFAPAVWPAKPSCEWCPPGHGDVYAALVGSGRLDKLLAEGVKYMFVSNSDNLGATMDVDLLTYFAQSGKPFLMEVCERTENDKKGGHLALRKEDNRLVLRESAQCATEDEASFQDITKHRFFNTNNLWIRLDSLKEALDANNGIIPLPMIKNSKTVDPQDSSSTPVFQLETAMGAAIECFDGAGAIIVPRSRFAPVKKCNDLLLLRSNAYVLTPDFRPVLAPSRNGIAPVITLDSKQFKLVQQLREATMDGVPGLLRCQRLTIKGQVILSSKVAFVGNVTVTNNSDEPKFLPPGTYEDMTVDITDQPSLGPLKPSKLSTTPIEGQKPGTSGLRKKTCLFMEGYYLHNFVQSTFNALEEAGTDVSAGTLVLGGDGRYFNKEAIQIILKIAVANGVRRVWVGRDGLLSTPAVSAIIREKGPVWQKAFGAFILTASHNPGGPNEDFGIKYNCENGGPALEKMTMSIFENTKSIKTIKICEQLPDIDISCIGETHIQALNGFQEVVVEVIDSCEQHVALLKSVFDFELIRSFLNRPDFSMVYDSMHGVQGPYARKVFCEELGLQESCLRNAVPKDDFGGGHADPNLTYAKSLVKEMGVDNQGLPVETLTTPPCFGAAADGDADRNMILGRRFFVTPSDSLAIIAAHANAIPFFRDQGGIKGVARSMPTSGAVDIVARTKKLQIFETPTGWKFFGNLMDSKQLGGENYGPFLCGEESFGTGSDHLREKDGLWAVLAWLTILAFYNPDPRADLVHVKDVVLNHWQTYGRNYYCRYDYEGVDKLQAESMMKDLIDSFASLKGADFDGYKVASADEFEYLDPVDGSISSNQGIRIIFADGSRIIFRLSGTAGSGATVRLYLEKYENDPAKLELLPSEALGKLVQIALQVSQLEEKIGRSSPTVIT